MRDYLLSFDPAYEKYLADDQTLSPDESRIAQVIIAVRGAIPALLAFRNVRGAFGAIPADWDDPAMDVYDGLPEGGADGTNQRRNSLCGLQGRSVLCRDRGEVRADASRCARDDRAGAA